MQYRSGIFPIVLVTGIALGAYEQLSAQEQDKYSCGIDSSAQKESSQTFTGRVSLLIGDDFSRLKSSLTYMFLSDVAGKKSSYYKLVIGNHKDRTLIRQNRTKRLEISGTVRNDTIFVNRVRKIE